MAATNSTHVIGAKPASFNEWQWHRVRNQMLSQHLRAMRHFPKYDASQFAVVCQIPTTYHYLTQHPQKFVPHPQGRLARNTKCGWYRYEFGYFVASQYLMDVNEACLVMIAWTDDPTILDNAPEVIETDLRDGCLHFPFPI